MAKSTRNTSSALTRVPIATIRLPSNVAGILDNTGIPFTANGIGIPIIITSVADTTLLAKTNQANAFRRNAIARSARHFGSVADDRTTDGIVTDLACSIIISPLMVQLQGNHKGLPLPYTVNL
jgi:hypothetical protein